MSQLLLTHHSQFHRAIRMRQNFPLSLRIGKFFLFFVMTFMIGLISFFYLIKFTEIHTKGYQLRKLEIERDQLVTAREIKTTEISRLKSLQQVQEGAFQKGLVPARNPVFIKKDGSVALLN